MFYVNLKTIRKYKIYVYSIKYKRFSNLPRTLGTLLLTLDFIGLQLFLSKIYIEHTWNNIEQIGDDYNKRFNSIST